MVPTPFLFNRVTSQPFPAHECCRTCKMHIQQLQLCCPHGFLPGNLPVNIIMTLPPTGALSAQPFPAPSLWSCGGWLRQSHRSHHPGAVWSPGLHFYLLHCHYFLPCTVHRPKHSLLLSSPVLPSESPVPCTSSSVFQHNPHSLTLVGILSGQGGTRTYISHSLTCMREYFSFCVCKNSPTVKVSELELNAFEDFARRRDRIWDVAACSAPPTGWLLN